MIEYITVIESDVGMLSKNDLLFNIHSIEICTSVRHDLSMPKIYI